MKKVHTTHPVLDTTFLAALSEEICLDLTEELSFHTPVTSGSARSQNAAPFSPPVGGAL